MKSKSLEVLLVEDELGDARLVREMLAEPGVVGTRFRITHVDRLDPAMRLLSTGRYDVVLLDLLLADNPRLGTLMEIYEQAARTPVIVLTGLEDEVVGLWALKEGAQDYLVKGRVDAGMLQESILHAIQRHSAGIGSGAVAKALMANAR
jgi:DNA-binding response OmpR family regulator